tara:strand:- start:276 stop:2243 length:1968 start_codon:yes stop_codon:yes gene_type:complete
MAWTTETPNSTEYTQSAGMDGETTTDNVTELVENAAASAAAASSDRVQTNLDRIATAADVVQTGADRSAVAGVVNDAIGVTVQAYDAVLDGTTASYTTAEETKIAGIEASADVTDTTNVTAAGALMDSELTAIASVKALDQGVSTTDSPTFDNLVVKKQYNTVSLLLADTADGAYFTVGDLVEVIEGGFSYKVATSGNLGQPNAGGIQFDVLAGDNGYNVKSFGAIGDGVTDDTAAIQAAFNGSDSSYFPAGTYECSNLEIDGGTESGGGKVIDASLARIQNTSGNGESLFRLARTTTVNLLDFKAKQLKVSAGGGHVFQILGAVNHSSIDVTWVQQSEASRGIINHDDTSFFFNKIKGLFWKTTDTHAYPALRFSSTSNKVTGNTFDILRPDRSGTRHYMELLSTSSSDYNYSNVISLRNPEVCHGGVLKLQRSFNTIVNQMHCFDTGATVNHMIEVGGSGNTCQNTKIRDYQRNSGTLGAGLVDIFLGDANYTYIEAASGVSSGTLIEIDINGETNTIITGSSFYNVSNPTTSNTLILTADEGVSTPKMLLTPQSAFLGIISGVITATDSVHKVDTEASASTDDLDTINGGSDGHILILRTNSSARDVTLKDGTGNLFLAGDFTLSRTENSITLKFDDNLSGWVEVSRSDNST